MTAVPNHANDKIILLAIKSQLGAVCILYILGEKDMARRTGFTPLFDASDIEARMEAFYIERMETKLIQTYMAAGEMFVKYARESGLYDNITGNLRSSIGYVVLNDGEVVMQSDFEPVQVMARAAFTEGGKHYKAIKESRGELGAKYGQHLINELQKEHPFGIWLIGVAGMDYAVYVEAMESKDVITGAAMKTNEWLRDAFKTITQG